MAKIGKLTKLKSAIKRWPSFTKLVRTNSSIASAAAANDVHHSKDDIQYDGENISKELQAVYVGKSRRRYLLSSDIICHPLFQGLMDRSGAAAGTTDDDGDVDDDLDHQVVVACEVVLFEHLLWMLESCGSQLGSTEELAEFYDCRTC